jgi:hypothetical protein
MTIKNTELAAEYFAILSDGHASRRLALIAETVDKAMEAAMDVFRAANVAFPNDDRCANIELAMYEAAKRAHK